MLTKTKEDEALMKVVGTRPVRPDGEPKVTGLAQYGADFSLPGMLWAKILRSPHAHARIRPGAVGGAAEQHVHRRLVAVHRRAVDHDREVLTTGLAQLQVPPAPRRQANRLQACMRCR